MTFSPDTIRLSSIAETPWGELKVCGYGTSGIVGREGFRFNVSFGDSASPVGYWSTDHGFESAVDRRRRVFDEQLASLKAPERAVIDLLFADRVIGEDRHTLKSPDRLVVVAKKKLIKDGRATLKTCGRCGGCGRYSYNQLDGDKCYGCMGSGKVLPTCREILKAIAA